MITLILGKKGSGKTKRLIDMCNSSVASSKGNVVFMEKVNNLTYTVSHKARLIVTDDYAIDGFDCLYGLLAGLCAGNYDITDIYVDSTLKIGGNDLTAFAAFVERLNALASQSSTQIVLSVSADKNDIPQTVAQTVHVL